MYLSQAGLQATPYVETEELNSLSARVILTGGLSSGLPLLRWMLVPSNHSRRRKISSQPSAEGAIPSTQIAAKGVIQRLLCDEKLLPSHALRG